MLRNLCVCLVFAALLGACAKPPQPAPSLSAYAHPRDAIVTGSIANAPVPPRVEQPIPPLAQGVLAGRTLTVASNAQLVLQPGEVVLTFDDGPRPGRTEAILDTLDAHGVKATFLMLGYAAKRHPELAQTVARRGHSIGTHTFDHVNLAELSNGAAIAEIQAGYDAVAGALAPIGQMPSRFFRFPYLAQTGVIRASTLDANFIVLDVDIDSKDYYTDSPRAVMDRTLARLDAQGRGIILFHDIHARTVAMLPDFLDRLRERGYKVVTLRASGGGVFDTPMVTADGPPAAASL